MKVILAGSSGFIGQEILHQALHNPSITSLIALSRRPLPTTNPKLKTVLLEDFTSYSPAVLAELSGAESCIWYICPAAHHKTPH
jgi:NAD dependent epimerase/dehydratase family enzyme